MAVESWLTFSCDWSTVQVINGEGIFQPGDLYSGKGARGGGWGGGLPREALWEWREEADPLLPRSKGCRRLDLEVCFLLVRFVPTSFNPCLKN